MDADLRETLRRRHEARLANEQRLREEDENARARAAEDEQRLLTRETRLREEARTERLIPLFQLQGELQDLTALVQGATQIGQVLPALRQVTQSVQDLYDPDLSGGEELVTELQNLVAQLVLAFNDNQGLVLQVGSHEYRSVLELIQTITATTGVDIEIAAPTMDTSRDEELARQLAEPQPAAASSRRALPSPVRVPDNTAELESYQTILTQLRTTRHASQDQVRAIVKQLTAPSATLTVSQRGQVRTTLENLLAYVRNRWGFSYDLQDSLDVVQGYVDSLDSLGN
jgi:hypothetical protein